MTEFVGSEPLLQRRSERLAPASQGHSIARRLPNRMKSATSRDGLATGDAFGPLNSIPRNQLRSDEVHSEPMRSG
jgi:hypothetical protein